MLSKRPSVGCLNALFLHLRCSNVNNAAFYKVGASWQAFVSDRSEIHKWTEGSGAE